MTDTAPSPTREMLTLLATPRLRVEIAKEDRVEAFSRAIRVKLKLARERASMEQTSVAQAMDVGQPAVSRIENGSGDIGIKTLYRYANAVGVRPVLLFVALTTPERLETESDRSQSSGHVVAIESAEDALLEAVSETLPKAIARILSTT